MVEVGKFIIGDPDSQPPDIDELAKQYGGYANIPMVHETTDGVRSVELTCARLMVAFCEGRDPNSVSDERWREILQNIASGKGHGG